MDSLEYWIITHWRLIWHYAWRIGFVLLLLWLQLNGYLSQLQLLCLAGFFYCLAMLLFAWVKHDRKKEMERLEGKDKDKDDAEESDEKIESEESAESSTENKE